MNKKISVIVPVYNVEDYLKKCLDSIIDQDYKNLEVIVVDDNSTDHSLEIAKTYEKYDFVKVLHNEENGGLSFSRNRGITESTGAYVSFIDSDDYIPRNYYSSLMKSMKNASIVVCDINIVYSNGTEVRQQCGGFDSKLDFINNGLAASACNKIFKKSLFKDVQFEVGKQNEDLAVILPLLLSNKVAYNDEVYYYYYQRNTSLQNAGFSEKRFDLFHAVSLTLERIGDVEGFSEYRDAIVYNQLIAFLMYVFEKEESFWKRYTYLKKFSKLAKPYQFHKNIFFRKFLSENRKLYRIYYGLLVWFNMKGLVFFDNLWIQVYKMYKNRKHFVTKSNITLEDLVQCARKQQDLPLDKKVSVVVPNYNYENFLCDRIFSILNQGYKIYELIILDDCSKDQSRKVIDEIVASIEPYISVRKIYNKKNSGKAFIQWEKGFDEAKGDYVWIAEADDYCSPKFLKRVMKMINDDTIIAYTDTAFIDASGKLILKSIVPEIDIMKTGHWNRSYVNSGVDEFNHYTFLNCTIANVSSAIIKKGDYHKEFELAKEYSQAGDWIFYAQLMHKGSIAYFKKAYNYYRVHGANVSSVTKKDAHLKEIQSIHKHYEEMYGLNEFQKAEIAKRYQFLRKVWDLPEE